MEYYAPAVALSLLMAFFLKYKYRMPNGVEVNSPKNFLVAFLILLPLTFVLVFRWDVGVDSLYGGSYWEAYHASADNENIDDFEPGFFLFMRLFAWLKIPYFWFLFTLSLMFMVFVSYAFTKGTVSTIWSVLIFFLFFFYFDAYSALRQSLAESMCLIAIAFIGYLPPSRKKDVIITGIFLFAALFHMLALLYVPLYWISKIRFSRKGMLKFSIISVLAYPVLQIVLRFAMQLISGEYTFMGVAVINAVITFGVFMLCWYFYDDISELDENAYMYVNLSLCIFILMLNSGALFLPFRCFDMLKISYVFIIPYLIKGIPNGRIRLFIGGALLLVFGFWFVNSFFLQGSSAANYQTALEDWETISNLP